MRESSKGSHIPSTRSQRIAALVIAIVLGALIVVLAVVH
jgi:hypothetical protein